MINLDDRIFTELLPKIKPNAFAVLLAIAKHMDRNNKAFPKDPRLRRMTGLGRDAVVNAKNVLVAHKIMLKKQRRGKGGSFGPNDYWINCQYIGVYIPAVGILEIQEEEETFKPFPENPSTVHPLTVHPSTGEPSTGFQGALSIKKEGSIKKKEVLRKRSIPLTPENSESFLKDDWLEIFQELILMESVPSEELYPFLNFIVLCQEEYMVGQTKHFTTIKLLDEKEDVLSRRESLGKLIKENFYNKHRGGQNWTDLNDLQRHISNWLEKNKFQILKSLKNGNQNEGEQSGDVLELAGD